jgi:hypothetical protein
MSSYPAKGVPVMADKGGSDSRLREWIAIAVVMSGIVASLSIGMYVIHLKPENATLVMSSLLPLWGTWVGTVLAYYYSGANFEAASKSTQELLSLDKKLASIPAREVMIPRAKIIPMTITGAKPEDTPIVNIRSEMDSKGVQRIPVLFPDDIALYMIHLSTLDQFLARAALKTPPVANMSQLTLQNLLTDAPDLGRILTGSFALIKESASLADAKMAMDTTPNCQDVFVTQNGKTGEAVIGWIPNNELAANSKA